MKKILVLLIQLFLNCLLFSENYFLGKRFSFIDEYGYVEVFQDKLVFDDGVEKGKFQSLNNYNVFKSANENYILLNYKNEDAEYLTLIKKVKSKNKYEAWEIPCSIPLSKKFENTAKLVGFNVKKAESFIVEKYGNGDAVKFLPEKFFNVTGTPWAVKNCDESSTICLTDERYMVPGCEYADIEELILINGFVDPEKPYLYEQNSRAKKIRIEYDNLSFTATLADSGNYQSIKLPQKIKRGSNTSIKITILDSYQGTKYSDIVISGILYVDACLK